MNNNIDVMNQAPSLYSYTRDETAFILLNCTSSCVYCKGIYAEYKQKHH